METKNKPLVSVLMTVYNREKYIAAAIESVLSSTYINWELIIVDDRSHDRSVEIARQYEAMDSRIKVHINEINLGDYPNRNKAASHAKGKYLKYVDADDLLYPFGLEQLVFYMEQFPNAGYGLCSLEQDTYSIFPFILKPKEAYHRHYIQKKWLFHKAPLSAIIKTENFKAVGGFTGKQHLGDYELWHLLSMNYNVVLMPHGIVWYRQHDDQQMEDNRTNPFVPLKYLVLEIEMLNHSNCPLCKDELKIAKKQSLRKQARYILKYFIKLKIVTGYRLTKESNLNFFQILFKSNF